jgi:hypothetical protein
MTIVSGKGAVVKKISPNGHLVLAWRPRKYGKTPQQVRAGNAARECGIHRGMSKAELVKAMSCVGTKMRRGG